MVIVTAPEGEQPKAEEKVPAKESIDETDPEKKKKAEKEKEKKKKKAAEKKEKEAAEAKPAEEKKEAETQPAGPVDVEKRIQEIMKNKVKQTNQPKKSGPNLEAAKKEILARQGKKTTDKKKDYDL